MAAYIEQLGAGGCQAHGQAAPGCYPATLRLSGDGGILPSNPAGSVRGPTYVVTRGKTPVLSADEMRQLLDSIDYELIGLRDRALIGVMGYSFARVSAAATLRVEDYFQQGNARGSGSTRKAGSDTKCRAIMRWTRTWTPGSELLALARTRKVHFSAHSQGQQAHRESDGAERRLYMIKRRAKEAALPYSTCCHTFRATGITTYLQNGGTLEHAQQIAAHQSPRTTKLYDRTQDEISLDEVERIKF